MKLLGALSESVWAWAVFQGKDVFGASFKDSEKWFCVVATRQGPPKGQVYLGVSALGGACRIRADVLEEWFEDDRYAWAVLDWKSGSLPEWATSWNDFVDQLVVLDKFWPEGELPDEEEIRRVERVDWWCEERYAPVRRILVRAHEIGFLIETEPVDAGGEVEPPLERIPDSLKRFNLEDGFYTA